MTVEPPEDDPPDLIEAANESDRKGLRWIGLLFLVVVVWVVVSQQGDDDEKSGSTGGGLATVTYHVGGSARSADITVETPTGTSQQSVSVPLTNKSGTRGLIFSFQPGVFVYISAQNNGSGTITCSIESNGLTISENSSTGEYAIATCDGRAL